MLYNKKYKKLIDSKFNCNSKFENDLIIKFYTKQFYIISTFNNNNIQNIITTVKTTTCKFGWHETN